MPGGKDNPQELYDLDVEEIALVDSGAIKRKFVIIKREEGVKKNMDIIEKLKGIVEILMSMIADMGYGYAYPSPGASKKTEEDKNIDMTVEWKNADEEIQKRGAKISKDKLNKLKEMFGNLVNLIKEVDPEFDFGISKKEPTKKNEDEKKDDEKKDDEKKDDEKKDDKTDKKEEGDEEMKKEVEDLKEDITKIKKTLEELSGKITTFVDKGKEENTTITKKLETITNDVTEIKKARGLSKKDDEDEKDKKDIKKNDDEKSSFAAAIGL